MVVWREIAVPTSLCIRSSHLYYLPFPLYISLLPLLALTLRWLAVGPPCVTVDFCRFTRRAVLASSPIPPPRLDIKVVGRRPPPA